MACGTPVACSGTSSLPEVAGDAALTFDPHNQSSIAETLRRVLEDVDLHRELVQRGLRQAARFSWERVAEETTSVYDAVISGA
jgi:alpha-1,3-rhamnosyl/mannosyltransferase